MRARFVGRSHDTLLSDEEAQEVVHLLSPSVESLVDSKSDSQWVSDVLSAIGSEDISYQRYSLGTRGCLAAYGARTARTVSYTHLTLPTIYSV